MCLPGCCLAPNGLPHNNRAIGLSFCGANPCGTRWNPNWNPRFCDGFLGSTVCGTMRNPLEPALEPQLLRWISGFKGVAPCLLIIILIKTQGTRNQRPAERGRWTPSRIFGRRWCEYRHWGLLFSVALGPNIPEDN